MYVWNRAPPEEAGIGAVPEKSNPELDLLGNKKILNSTSEFEIFLKAYDLKILLLLYFTEM